ncbi:hypothetical protein LJC33_05100 [Eubacteriales bacterium OttesenSCG-928-N13]|nr:hypothetical protein [Eubacteriales bacterium OttesenSCG-928-N13]
MGHAYIYTPDAEDFDSLGLAGALTANTCEFEEIAGGMSQLTLEHPLDALGRYRLIKPGYIIKAPVPVRTTPEIDGTQIVTSVEKWTVSPLATKAQRYLYTKSTKGKKKKCLPADLGVIVTNRGTDRYKVKTSKYGTGWIDKEALTGGVSEVIPDTPAGIETAMPASSVQPQLFRIKKVEQSETGIRAEAEHISYDLMGNVSHYVADNPTADQAIQGILSTTAQPHDFTAYTDVADQRIDIDYRRENPIKALLDPEAGVLARWGLELVRDDYELYLLSNAGVDRGVRIEYGKNMLGVNCKTETDGVITMVLPVGESKEGKPVYLTSDPNKVSETITPSSYISSGNVADYATPHIMVLDVAEAKIDSKKGGSHVTPALAAARMRDAANQVFANGGHLPTVNLTVDWLRLGDTVEYAQFAELDNAFLYDPVTVIHQPLGIKATLKVVRIKFDCLTGNYLETELGTLGNMLINSTLTTWQIPQGISGGKLALGSIDGAQLADDTINTRHVQAETVTADKINSNLITVGWFQAGVAQITVAAIETADIDWANIQTLNATMATVAKAQINTANIIAANINWAQIQTLSADIATIAVAQLTTANIEDADIDWAQIDSLQASVAQLVQASIGTADIGYAQIKDLVTGTAIITSGAAGQLYINRLNVTDANMVSLTVGEILLKGEDGQFYRLTLDESGEVVGVPVQVEGDNIGDDTIPAGKLIENTISAREINVAELFADSATFGAIKSANIDVADFWASTANIGKVTTNMLASDVGANLDIRSNETIQLLVNSNYVRLTDAGLVISTNDPNNHFRVLITENSVQIQQDGQSIADFSGNQMHAEGAELRDRLKIGNWLFITREDGGMSILKE